MDFVLFRLPLPGTRLPQPAGWPRRRTRARQAWDSGNRPEGRLYYSRQPASQQGNHHRDETVMAFPGRTRLRSPPLEPAVERARPAATLSKGHRAEMELWRNKKALDLRGHRTTPHRSGERRGYRSETESPCDQVNEPATVRERLAPLCDPRESSRLPGRCVRPWRTNLPVERLSLNRSQ